MGVGDRLGDRATSSEPGLTSDKPPELKRRQPLVLGERNLFINKPDILYLKANGKRVIRSPYKPGIIQSMNSNENGNFP